MDKFDEFLESLKETKSNERLSESFKENLVKKMDEEYSKTRKDRFKDFVNKFKSNSLSFSQKFAIVFSLFIIISGVAFGKNIVDWAKEVFSNQDKSVDLAIENGYYQNIDMDYIYHDGVGIKVDYLYCDESCIYIAFNVKTEGQYDNIYLENIELKNENDELIYDYNNSNKVFSSIKIIRVTKYEKILFAKYNTLNNNFDNINSIRVDISNLELEKNNVQKKVDANWKFYLEVQKFLKTEEINYSINSDDMIKDYLIKKKNNTINVNLIFNNIKLDEFEMNRDNIYLEDESGNIYNCKELSLLKEKELELNFSINSNNDIDNLKLIINYKNNRGEERIVLYLHTQSG